MKIVRIFRSRRYSNIRWIVYLGLLSSGCDNAQTRSVDRGDDKNATNVPQQSTKQRDVTEESVSVPKGTDLKREPRPAANSPTLQKAYLELPKWNAEPEPFFTRQRPVALLIICEDYGDTFLKSPARVTMEFASGLANSGYDVNILVGTWSSESPETHWSVGYVTDQICKINQSLGTRNELEQENKTAIDDTEHSRIAPLKLLAQPCVFSTRMELKRAIKQWLKDTFQVASLNSRVGKFDGRPPFGLIYFNGHGGWHERPASQAHGGMPEKESVSRDVFYSPPDLAIVADRKRLPTLDHEVSVQDVAHTAAVAYHAPLWICADMCRTHSVDDSPPINRSRRSNTALRPRELALDSVPAELKSVIKTVEQLREKALASSAPFEESLKHATLLFPDQAKKSVEDSDILSLGHWFAGQLRVAPNANDKSFHFVRSMSDSLTLAALLHSAEQGIHHSLRELNSKSAMKIDPDFGPVDKNMVVASTIRGFKYPRGYVNVLSNNLRLQTKIGRFTIPHAGNGNRIDAIASITRNQTTYKKDFTAYFDLRTPYTIAKKQRSKLVLRVVAQHEDVDEEIKFVVGVYGPHRVQLTTEFEEYGKSHSHREPVPCDGNVHFREVPLDAADEDLHHIEIQADPYAAEEGWPEGATLFLTGAYLVPLETELDDLNSLIEDNWSASQELIQHWWCMTPLKVDKSHSIVTSLHSGGTGPVYLRMANSKAHEEPWGVIGDLYPRRVINKSKHRLRLKIASPRPSAESATITVCLYSGNSLLAAETATCHEFAQPEGVDITPLENGVADEIAVMVQGCTSVIVQELSIVEADAVK